MKVSKHNCFYSSLVIPWIIILLVFWIYPFVWSIVLSFGDYNSLLNSFEFTGLKNYGTIFQDKLFWKALKNTIIFTFGTVPVTTSLAILLAMFINSKTIKWKNFFKTTIFIPSVTSLVVISLIFMNLYSKNGYINLILKSLGLPFPQNGWLQSADFALPAIMIMDVWMSTGYYTVLFLAALQAIPEEYYDAAKIMGAHSWKTFWKITLPSTRSMLLFIIVINTIKSFQIFVEIYVMTKGGPINSTTTLVYLIYSYAFEKTNLMGYASAIAILLFIILAVLSFVQFKLIKER